MSYLQRDLYYLWGQGHLALVQHQTHPIFHIQQTFAIVSTISGQQDTLESAYNDSLLDFKTWYQISTASFVLHQIQKFMKFV